MKGHLEAAYLVNFPAFPNSHTFFMTFYEKNLLSQPYRIAFLQLADCFTNFKGPSGFKNPRPRTLRFPHLAAQLLDQVVDLLRLGQLGIELSGAAQR